MASNIKRFKELTREGKVLVDESLHNFTIVDTLTGVHYLQTVISSREGGIAVSTIPLINADGTPYVTKEDITEK